VASGLIALPARFFVSAVFRGTSGPFFSAAGAAHDVDGDGVASLRQDGTVRNQFRAPRTLNVDLRVEKRFRIGRYTASALVEWFNLLNTQNPALIFNNYNATAATEAFGSIRVPLPGRETQFGVRFMF
jgi:hypothetical protein